MGQVEQKHVDEKDVVTQDEQPLTENDLDKVAGGANSANRNSLNPSLAL